MADEFIGKYRIIEKIGSGGMAKVYLASHKDVPNLRVVLKILTDNRLIERFKQEADKMALLDGHGNICQIKHFFDHGDDLVIAMEYIHGQTLEDLIKARGRIPVKESVEIIIRVLETLQFAHNKRIFHRDIKPGNIMIDDEGKIKIIDFGIAKAEDDPDLTIAGSACGTPAYMAPEQFTPSVRTNYALVDVYAVGSTLFYMLTGELPFKGENQFVLRDAKLFNDPPKPTSINKEIPKKLERIVLKSLDKDYHERHQSAEALREELEEFMDESGIGTKEPTYDEITQVTETGGKHSDSLATRPKGRKPIWISSAVILLAAIVYILFFREGEISSPDPPDLIGPEQEAQIEGGRVTFNWEATAGEQGRYELQAAADEGFDDLAVRMEVLMNRYTLPRDLDSGSYYWRVRAIDSSGIRSDFSEVREFTISPSGEEKPLESGELSVTIVPSGDLYINGRKEASNTDSFNTELPPGEYEIRAENPNTREKQISREIAIKSGESSNLRLRFTALPQEPDYGQIRIGTRPPSEAEVYIDGKIQALKTPNTYRVTAGRHDLQVKVEIDGIGYAEDTTVTVGPDEIVKLIFDLK